MSESSHQWEGLDHTTNLLYETIQGAAYIKLIDRTNNNKTRGVARLNLTSGELGPYMPKGRHKARDAKTKACLAWIKEQTGDHTRNNPRKRFRLMIATKKGAAILGSSTIYCEPVKPPGTDLRQTVLEHLQKSEYAPVEELSMDLGREVEDVQAVLNELQESGAVHRMVLYTLS